MKFTLIYKTITNLAKNLKELISKPLNNARLHKRFPTCRFYWGASVDLDSSLGKYNVLFNNVSLMNSSIGDHTFIQKNSLINCAVIGKFCSIAPNVMVGAGQHPTDFVSSHPAFYSPSQPIVKTFCDPEKYPPFKKTTIGHDV